MKPVLDNMTDLVVESLSREARSFYDREFRFFQEVTSISGKLRPYIKRPKPEKKVRFFPLALDTTSLFLRQRLMKRWQKSPLTLAFTFQATQTGKLSTSTNYLAARYKATQRLNLSRSEKAN